MTQDIPFDHSQLADDLLWIRDMAAGNPGWLLENTAFVCNRVERGLDSRLLYLATVDTILDLLALALNDSLHLPTFTQVALLVAEYPTQLNTPFQVDFRSVIAEFQPVLAIYTTLDSACLADVDLLLQAYIRLFKTLSFNHGMKIQRDLIDQSLAVSTRLDDHMENARLNQVLALYYTHYGDMRLAAHHGQRAFEDFEYVEDANGVADAACTLAIVYRADLRLPRATYYVNRALKVIAGKPPDKRVATLHYEKGALSHNQCKYDQALIHYQEALTLFEQFGAVYQIAMTNQAMAQSCIYLKDYARAENLLYIARRGWEKLDNKYDFVNSYFVEGDLELQRGRRREALALFRQTIDMAYNSLEDTPGRAWLIEIIELRIAANA